MKAFNKFKSLAKATLRETAKDNIIEVGGDLFVFDRWCITQEDDLWVVLNEGKIVFSSKRAALAWCLYTHEGNDSCANTIHNLDQALREKRFDLAVWNNVMDDIDPQRRKNAALRADYALNEIDTIKNELDEVISYAKYKQAEGV